MAERITPGFGDAGLERRVAALERLVSGFGREDVRTLAPNGRPGLFTVLGRIAGSGNGGAHLNFNNGVTGGEGGGSVQTIHYWRFGLYVGKSDGQMRPPWDKTSDRYNPALFPDGRDPAEGSGIEVFDATAAQGD